MSKLYDKRILVYISRTWHMKNGEEDLKDFLDEIKCEYQIRPDMVEYQEWVIEKSLHKAIIRWGEPLIDWLLPE